MRKISLWWHVLRGHRFAWALRYGNPEAVVCECGRQWWMN